MEEIWYDLTRNAPESLSPHWHEEVLASRSQRVQEGKEDIYTWNEAREKLKIPFHENPHS
jgi:hypothetical protein